MRTRQGEAEGRPTWDMTMKYAAIGKWRMPGGAECQACQTCHVGLYLGYLGLKIGVCLKDLKEPRNLGNSMIFFSLVLFLYLLLGFLGLPTTRLTIPRSRNSPKLRMLAPRPETMWILLLTGTFLDSPSVGGPGSKSVGDFRTQFLTGIQ